MLNETAFLKVYVIDVYYSNQNESNKKLLMNLDGSNWKLCDLNGVEEMIININVVVPPYPVEAVIDDNGMKYIGIDQTHLEEIIEQDKEYCRNARYLALAIIVSIILSVIFGVISFNNRGYGGNVDAFQYGMLLEILSVSTVVICGLFFYLLYFKVLMKIRKNKKRLLKDVSLEINGLGKYICVYTSNDEMKSSNYLEGIVMSYKQIFKLIINSNIDIFNDSDILNGIVINPYSDNLIITINKKKQ